jgi:uncharacterized membrane protein (UPF0136 family)
MTVALGFRVVLICYIVLLLVGGLIGFLKAGSRISLITSVAFAAALAFCEFGIADGRIPILALLAVLVVVFAIRWTKTRKFMPSGLMVVVTVVAVITEGLLQYVLR